MIQQEVASPTDVIGSFGENACVAVIGGTYRGSVGVLVKETASRYKIRFSTGREVYLKKEKIKCAEAHSEVANSLVQLPALVVGGTYSGSTGVLVKETDFRYKICLSTGREVYLKKGDVKVQWEDPGDVAKDLLKFQYPFV